jgi:hypothetical protein
MTNSTPIYWEANGLSLHTFNRAVASFGGNRYVPVTKRGEDVTIPFHRGQTYRPKERNPQALTLSMWSLPLNEDGTVDDTLSLDQKQHENWNQILRALDVDGQYPIVKRWWQDGEVVSATGYGETLGGLEPTVDGGHRLTFDVEILMSDPYFYGPWTTLQTASSLSPVAGDVPTNRVRLVLPSGASSPRITFPQRPEDPSGVRNWIEFDGTPTSDITIDCFFATAKNVSNQYVNGKVRRNPKFPAWPTLRPGDQALTVSGGGQVQYQPAYR